MKITQIEAFALRYQKEKPAEQQTDNYYLPDGRLALHLRTPPRNNGRPNHHVRRHCRLRRRTESGLTAHLENDR